MEIATRLRCERKFETYNILGQGIIQMWEAAAVSLVEFSGRRRRLKCNMIKRIWNEVGPPTDLTGLRQWRITVPGDPVGQKRYAPTTRKGKKATYDPSSTQKETFRFYCLNGVNDRWPDTPLVGAVMIDLRFYFERPTTHYVNRNRTNKLKKTAPVYHTNSPDYDNCIKFVCDALNGKYYKDDRQICGGPPWKSWSDNPRTEVIITALENR